MGTGELAAIIIAAVVGVYAFWFFLFLFVALVAVLIMSALVIFGVDKTDTDALDNISEVV